MAGRILLALALGVACFASSADAASACVWRVTGPGNRTLYLGGSVHALRSTDYPLPGAFNRAFELSQRLAFEVDEKASAGAAKDIAQAGRYPKGDTLKNHVDPRTYDYLRRLFAIMKVPETSYASLRPWMLVLTLQSPRLYGYSEDLGVERFLSNRAKANSKPVFGLESLREHMAVFSGLSDRQSEALLLITFIPQEQGGNASQRVMAAWRRGDADQLARMTHESFREFPAFGERILEARNRKWVPKIERYLQSGQTYFVVVGAAHMGGPGGLLSLLRARGCQLEQL